MYKRTLTLDDFEELNDIAESILTSYRYNHFFFNDDGEKAEIDYGNLIADLMEDFSKNDPTDFQRNQSLRNLTFHDAIALSWDTIRDRYLKDTIYVLKNIMKKDPFSDYNVSLGDDISDEFIEKLFCLRWKENLKLHTMQWEQHPEVLKMLDFLDAIGTGQPEYIEDKNIPYFDKYQNCWRLFKEGFIYEGEEEYVIGEFIGDNLNYPYYIQKNGELTKIIAHTLGEVLADVLTYAESFSIEEFHDFYSKQELVIIQKLKEQTLGTRKKNEEDKHEGINSHSDATSPEKWKVRPISSEKNEQSVGSIAVPSKIEIE